MATDPKVLASAHAAVAGALPSIHTTSDVVYDARHSKDIIAVTADPYYLEVKDTYRALYNGNGGPDNTAQKAAFIKSLKALNALPDQQRHGIAGQLLLDAAQTGDTRLAINVGGYVSDARNTQFQLPGNDKPVALYDLLRKGNNSNPQIPKWEGAERGVDKVAVLQHDINKLHDQQFHPAGKTPAQSR